MFQKIHIVFKYMYTEKYLVPDFDFFESLYLKEAFNSKTLHVVFCLASEMLTINALLNFYNKNGLPLTFSFLFAILITPYYVALLMPSTLFLLKLVQNIKLLILMFDFAATGYKWVILTHHLVAQWPLLQQRAVRTLRQHTSPSLTFLDLLLPTATKYNRFSTTKTGEIFLTGNSTFNILLNSYSVNFGICHVILNYEHDCARKTTLFKFLTFHRY